MKKDARMANVAGTLREANIYKHRVAGTSCACENLLLSKHITCLKNVAMEMIK